MAYPDKVARAVQTDAGTLYRFANDIDSGDWIVYPSKHNRMVNIGKATGRKWHDAAVAAGEDAKPNFIGVKWLGHFPRSDFSQAALNEIGSFITLFRVRKHASEFLAKVGSSNEPIQSEPEEEQGLSDDVASLTASSLAEENT